MRDDVPNPPPLIATLIEAGRWPATREQEGRQQSEPLVPPDLVATVAPEETEIILHAPPYRTVADLIAEYEAGGSSFWTDHGAISELDPERALLIADFGLGTDSPIVLDHRPGPEPSVLALTWQASGDEAPFTLTTRWTMLAVSLEEFARKLGLL